MQVHRLLVLTLLSLGFSAQALDWPQWRGPDRTDISKETGLLKQWPAGGPKLVWLYKDAGKGYASVATSGGKLFTMGVRDDMDQLIALDPKSGKQLWATPIAALLIQDRGDGPRGTPTVDGDRVYAMSGNGTVLCAKVADGKEVWKASLRDFGGQTPKWGYSESVLVDEGRVICTPGGDKGTLLALDKLTGKKLWQTQDWTDGADYSSPIVVTHNGARQYIQLTQKNLAGVDAKSGKVLWKSEWPGKTAVIPTPIFHDGHVYIASGYGVGCKLVKLGPGHTVTDVWMNQNMINHHGGVILVGSHLYGYSDKNGWTCQDWKTGDIVWAEKKLGKGAVHYADGMLYLLDEGSSTVVLIEASPKGWNEHGRYTLNPTSTQRSRDGKIWAHPVVSDGKLYLRDQELLFCYDVKGALERRD